MRPFATTLLCAVLLALFAWPAQAQGIQDVTVRQLNQLPAGHVAQLNALGMNAAAADYRELLTNEFEGQQVRVQAVVLSDPRYSGLAGINVDTGIPNRIHMFVRDVNALEEGMDGMGIQVVDDTRTGLSLDFRVGDIIEIEGILTIFGTNNTASWQLAPIDAEAIRITGQVEPGSPLLDPVLITTDELNRVIGEVGGEPVVQTNWDNFSRFNGQYVRVEEAIITNSEENPTGRPNWSFATAGTDAEVMRQDVSLRYRNDRSTLGAPFFARSANDPYVPPAPNSVANIQGFVLHQAFDAFNLSQPQGMMFAVNPITDEDVEVTVGPPQASALALDAVPTGDFTVEAVVRQGGDDPLTEVNLNYEFWMGASGSVGMTPVGDERFTATLPAGAQADGTFVTFTVSATDAAGRTATTRARQTRVLAGGITSIEHVQLTQGEVAGPSPFAGITTAMDIEAVVMTDPATSRLLSIQDGTDPWSGVFLVYTEALGATLNRGDRVRITRAQIQESNGLTRLQVSPSDVEVIGAGEPFDYVTFDRTGLFAQDPDFAESYEGMAIRFDNVIVTRADAGFGEWAFSHDGMENNEILADDESPEIPFGSDFLEDGQELDFIQGIWTFTFGNYKLWPETQADLGLGVSTEDGAVARALTLGGAFPNPVAHRATLDYTLARDGHVRLEVFDVVGRRVAVLADGVQAAGPQQATFEANGLASGLYLVRLAVGDAVATTKVIVTR